MLYYGHLIHKQCTKLKLGQTTFVRAVDGGDDLGIGPVRHLNRYQRSPSEHINCNKIT